MSIDAIELVPLGTMTAILRAPHPVGTRLIFEVEDGWIEGGRLNAKMKGQLDGSRLTYELYEVR